MSSFKRALLFGMASGLLWSAIPSFLSELFHQPSQLPTVAVAGILTGITVSLVLLIPLRRVRRVGTFLLGLVSLPLGGFVFGVSVSLVQFLYLNFSGVAYRFVQYGFEPLRIGNDYARGSLIPMFAPILIPLAVLSTSWLRHEIRKGVEIQG